MAISGSSEAGIHRQIDKIGKDYEHIVIDAPGRAEAIARSIIIASNVVMIPVQPSPYDVWAAQDVLKIIEEAQVYNENLKIVFAIYW